MCKVSNSPSIHWDFWQDVDQQWSRWDPSSWSLVGSMGQFLPMKNPVADAPGCDENHRPPQWYLPIIAFDAVNGEAWKGHFESSMNGK